MSATNGLENLTRAGDANRRTEDGAIVPDQAKGEHVFINGKKFDLYPDRD